MCYQQMMVLLLLLLILNGSNSMFSDRESIDIIDSIYIINILVCVDNWLIDRSKQVDRTRWPFQLISFWRNVFRGVEQLLVGIIFYDEKLELQIYFEWWKGFSFHRCFYGHFHTPLEMCVSAFGVIHFK